MLKYSYRLTRPSETTEVNLDEMYVSPDLSFISGCTTMEERMFAGESMWIESPYYPDDLMTSVTASDIVKRNGYIEYPRTLQVYTTQCFDEEGQKADIRFVEYGGNTYFQNSRGFFTIDNVNYYPNGSVLEITDRAYIEDGKVEISGVTLNAFVNNESEIVLSDMVGLPYQPDPLWDFSNVTSASTYVNKVSIGKEILKTIGCKGVSSYGFRACIYYNGEKKYIEYFYDNSGTPTDAGVIIDGVEYSCDALYAGGDSEDVTVPNIYDRNSYNVDYSTGNAYMTIDEEPYIITFEPAQIDGTGIICVETELPDMPILLGDRLRIKINDVTSDIEVIRDGNERGFVYYCGRKYEETYNLCDKVVMSGVEHMLSYTSDPESLTTSSIAKSVMNDGREMYFRVSQTQTDSAGIVRATKAKRVELINGSWVDQYTVKGSGGVASYQPSDEYDVITCDGIDIDGTVNEITHKDNIYYNGEEEIDEDYECIYVYSSLEYVLKVIDVVGNDKILCIPDINTSIYTDNQISDVSDTILASIYDGNFVIEKRPNTFGVTDLYLETWMAQSLNSYSATSIYDIADIRNNIKPHRKTRFTTIPIQLCRPVSDNMLKDELITWQYYDEKEAEAINPIVDMDKDMYTPVFDDGASMKEVEGIEFNLHFRTRDLETWKINVDEGTVTEGGTTTQLSANYQYTNWFVTDYFPYNSLDVSKCVDKSDLLGFLYFTTNDVEEKREKLRKSFLRLTFFDSMNPEKQNMLGTSTLYFDYERYFNILKERKEGIYYDEVAMSRNRNRMPDEDTDDPAGKIPLNWEKSPNVLTEAYTGDGTSSACTLSAFYDGDEECRIDSRITISDPFTSEWKSSEGYFAYIIKAFGDKRKRKTVYVKMEFFHAGVGVKVPMILPTDNSQDQNAISSWNSSTMEAFKKGYDLGDIFQRLYIPIDIWYSTELRKFVYSVSSDRNFLNATRKDNRLVFNIFELKVKAN